MTPIFGKHHEPDERPSAGEIAVAVGLALLVVAAIWLDGLTRAVQP